MNDSKEKLRWKKLKDRIRDCENILFQEIAEALIKKKKEKVHQKDNIYRLLDLACSEIDNASDARQNDINNLIQITSWFIDDNNLHIDFTKSMRTYCEALDYRVLPDWLQKMIGIVFIIMTVALIAAAIALVISLTGGTVGVLIAALIKPVIDVVAVCSIIAGASATIGVTAGTGATITLAGVGAIVASWTGMGSGIFFFKPYTNCVENIITANSKAANN